VSAWVPMQSLRVGKARGNGVRSGGSVCLPGGRAMSLWLPESDDGLCRHHTPARPPTASSHPTNPTLGGMSGKSGLSGTSCPNTGYRDRLRRLERRGGGRHRGRQRRKTGPSLTGIRPPRGRHHGASKATMPAQPPPRLPAPGPGRRPQSVNSHAAALPDADVGLGCTARAGAVQFPGVGRSPAEENGQA